MKKKLADCHSHSSFSFDSETPAAGMAEAAIEKNLEYLCITEHKDLDPLYQWTDYYDDPGFSREIESLNERFKDRIYIGKGVEIDFQSSSNREFIKFCKKHTFDFMLASVHALDHEFVEEDFFKRNDPEKAYRDYFLEVLNLSEHDCFDVIGHLDYIKRYGCAFHRYNPEDYKNIIEKILFNIIRKGKGIEINTAGWDHAPSEPYPSPWILTKYRQMGGEIITLGSDAHSPEKIARHFDRAVRLLTELGFDRCYHYKAGIPVSIRFFS